MVKFLNTNLSARRCNAFCILLTFLWVLGLAVGTGVSVWIHDDLYNVISLAVDANISVLNLVFAIFVPFLLSFLCLHLSSTYLFLLAFIKSFIFSFVYVSYFLTFETSAWLICFLSMFSDLFSLPILWLIWLRPISESQYSVLRTAFLSLSAVFLICCVDYSYVAPFLDKLV